MKSKFTFWAYLIPVIAFLFTGLSLSLLWSLTTEQANKDNTPLYFGVALMLFSTVWLIFGELRTKATVVKINSDNIILSKFLGAGTEEEFSFDYFDGFAIAILPSRGKAYEYLYLMTGNKKAIKLSEFYHKNYYELKQEISKNSKFLGNRRFSYLAELKEIFI